MPESVRRRWFDLPAGRLAALEAEPVGDGGGTVVMVPGYTGSKEDFLPLLAPIAAAGHRVVAYDQRGQYESAGPERPEAYAVGALAAELAGLLRALGGRPAHVVGHSFGGLVARAATIAEPRSVRSLTLLDSGPAAIDGARAEHIRLLRPILDAQGPAAVWGHLEASARAGGARAVPADVAAFLRERFFASAPAGLRAMGEELLAEPDRVDELRATGVPVLVAYGTADDAWPPARQAEMAARLDARHVAIEGAAHSPNVEAPAATVAALLEFWAGVEGG